MNSNEILTDKNTDNATGTDGLDNMERTFLKMFSPSFWRRPLPKAAAIAMLNIMAKIKDGGE